MSGTPLRLDGSQGEGGGQVLRSALTLSLCLGRPFRMINIRAKRRNPGLARQHLMAVRAAATVGRAEVRGAELGSQTLEFVPSGVFGGDYRFDIGSAGSTTLVLHTLVPALLHADRPSRITVIGGTHNPLAPPFEHFAEAYLPLLERMGALVRARMERAGYYPRGGGVVTVTIQPARLRPIELMERGPVENLQGEARVAALPRHIAEREARVLREGLDLPEPAVTVVEQPRDWGPGNVCLLWTRSTEVTEVFSGIGEKGVPAETVAGRVVEETRRYLDAGVPVGEHLADQLMIPLALAGGGRYLTLPLSGHSLTNRRVIETFLPWIRFHFASSGNGWIVTVTRSPRKRSSLVHDPPIRESVIHSIRGELP